MDLIEKYCKIAGIQFIYTKNSFVLKNYISIHNNSTFTAFFFLLGSVFFTIAPLLYNKQSKGLYLLGIAFFIVFILMILMLTTEKIEIKKNTLFVRHKLKRYKFQITSETKIKLYTSVNKLRTSKTSYRKPDWNFKYVVYHNNQEIEVFTVVLNQKYTTEGLLFGKEILNTLNRNLTFTN